MLTIYANGFPVRNAHLSPARLTIADNGILMYRKKNNRLWKTEESKITRRTRILKSMKRTEPAHNFRQGKGGRVWERGYLASESPKEQVHNWNSCYLLSLADCQCVRPLSLSLSVSLSLSLSLGTCIFLVAPTQVTVVAGAGAVAVAEVDVRRDDCGWSCGWLCMCLCVPPKSKCDRT